MSAVTRELVRLLLLDLVDWLTGLHAADTGGAP